LIRKSSDFPPLTTKWVWFSLSIRKSASRLQSEWFW
jgi:hypothetical protein